MRVGKANGSDWLRLSETAGLLGVGHNTIRRWSDSGRLKCYRSPGGHRRFRRRDVEALLGGGAGSGGGPATAADALDPSTASLDTLARLAVEALGIDVCRISAATPDGAGRILAAAGADTPIGRPAPGDPGAAATPAAEAVLLRGLRTVVPDLETTRLLAPEAVAFHRARGERAILALPVADATGVVGALELIAADARSFDAADVALGDLVARQAARAVTGRGAVTPRKATLSPAGRRGGLAAAPPLVDGGPAVRGRDAMVHAALEAMVGRGVLLTATVYMVDDGVATPYGAPPSPADGGSPWSVADYPAASAAMDRGEPVPAAAGEPGWTADSRARFLEARGLGGVVLTPLACEGEQAGLLELGTAGTAELPEAVGLARVSADLFALALVEGTAIERLQRRVAELSEVIQAGLDVEPGYDVEVILQGAAQRLATVTGSPVVDLYRLEGRAMRAIVSLDGGRFDKEWEGMVVPLDRYPLNRQAAVSGQPASVASAQDLPVDDEIRLSLEKWGYQAQLVVPLTTGDRIIGLLEISDHDPHDYSADIDLVSVLARVATNTLEYADLFEREDRRSLVLSELVELGALVSGAHDLEALLPRVAERLLPVLDAADVDVFLQRDDAFVCVASFDRSGHDPDAVGNGLDLRDHPELSARLGAGQAFLVSSPDDPALSAAQRRTFREWGYAAEIAVPLVVDGVLRGVIVVYDTRERDFGEYVSFLRSAAQTLSGAVEIALLLGELRSRTSTLRDVVDLGALAAQAREPGEVLATLAERLRATIGAADCDIFALEGDRLRCLVSVDANGSDERVVGHRLHLEAIPAFAAAVESGEVIVIRDLDDPLLTDSDRRDMAVWGYRSEICIPLFRRERAIGLVEVYDTRPRDYGEYTDLLQSVGQIAAGAIGDALLLAEFERHNAALDELIELGRVAAGAGGVGELVREVAPRLTEFLAADGCQIFVVRDDALLCLQTYENGEFLEGWPPDPIPLGHFPSTRTAIARRDALVIESPDDPRLSDHERRRYAESDMQSEVRVPLTLDDEVIGLIGLWDHRPRDYAEHLEFLLRAGRTLAGAFHTALRLERLLLEAQERDPGGRDPIGRDPEAGGPTND